MTRLRNVRIVSKTVFLGASVQVFQDGINIWIGRLSKEDSPSMVQVDIIQFVEELYRAKRGGNSLALLELRLPPSPALGEQITVSSTSRLRTHTDYTAGFPGFPVYRRQMSDCGIYQPPKCLSLSPLSLLYIYTQRDNIVTHSYI